MAIRLHSHAKARLTERGATLEEVTETVKEGEISPANLGRTRFRRNFVYNDLWRGRLYATKQVEVIAVRDRDEVLVLTVITRYF